MSLALFTHGYLSMATDESVVIKEYMYNHLQEILQDVEVYGWKVVKDYHAAWLQLMEHGQAAWGDAAKKEKLQQLLAWCKPTLGAKHADPTGAPARQQCPSQAQCCRSRFGYISQPSKPGDKACLSFNWDTCHTTASNSWTYMSGPSVYAWSTSCPTTPRRNENVKREN